MSQSNKRKRQPVGIGMEPTKTELGAFVRERRLELDLSQDEVGAVIPRGHGSNVVSMIELGTRKYLADDQLIALANMLRVDVEALRSRMGMKRVRVPTTKLGKLIWKRREKLGLSIEAFAKLMEVSPEQARELELRKSPTIPCTRVPALAKALQLKPEKLLPFAVAHERETMNVLGTLVRKTRKVQGMSQVALAAQLGVCRQIVYIIESGKYSFERGSVTLERIAEVLGLHVASLYAVQPNRKQRKYQNRSAALVPNPHVPETLGSFFAAQRKALRITQAELARLAKISCAAVSAAEAGRGSIGRDVYDGIVKALRCEVPVEFVPAVLRGRGRPRRIEEESLTITPDDLH